MAELVVSLPWTPSTSEVVWSAAALAEVVTVTVVGTQAETLESQALVSVSLHLRIEKSKTYTELEAAPALP